MGLQKLTNALRRMLNGDVQSQYKAGYRNGELELTDRGKNALLEMIAGEKEKELADDAREYIKEYEENKKKNSDEKK